MKSEDSATAKKEYPRIEAWRIILLEGDPRFANDPKVDLKVEGKIFGSPYPQFPDGAIIQTLPLIAFDIAMRRAATVQAVYELGEVDPTFLEYVKSIGKKFEDYNLGEKNLRNKPKAGL